MRSSTPWLIFAAVIVTGLLVYLLSPVLSPFLTGALLAYLGDPLVDRLEARKLPRTVAVVLVFVTIMLFLVLLPLVILPVMQQQVSLLAGKLPLYIDKLQKDLVPGLARLLNLDAGTFQMEAVKEAVKQHWREVGNFAGAFINTIMQSGVLIVRWLANLVLVPVVTFYLLRDWDILVERIHGLLPRRIEASFVRLVKEADQILGQFLRGQLLVMSCLGAVYCTGLWIVGLDMAILIGTVAGLVSFVPYLGVIVGLVLTVVATAMQFGDIAHFIYVALVFALGQMLEGMVLTPLLVGDKIGLHPVAVIFAVMAGGQLFGFVGILLALPAAAVIMVFLRHLRMLYKRSDLYGNKGANTPGTTMDNS